MKNVVVFLVKICCMVIRIVQNLFVITDLTLSLTHYRHFTKTFTAHTLERTDVTTRLEFHAKQSI